MCKQKFSNLPLPLSNEQLNCLQNLMHDLSIMQIAWVSGYLWGYIYNKEKLEDSKDDIVQKVKKDNLYFITILYASQSGNSRKLAQQLFNDLINIKLKVRLINTIDYKFKNISKEFILLVIISTYGEGNPPEEALSFYDFLFSKKAPLLNNIYYAVFGLGDSSYEHFAKTGRDFDNRLEELGAKRLCTRVDADVNYCQQWSIWRDGIINLLKNKIREVNLSKSKIDQNSLKKQINYSNFSKDNPFIACLSVRQRITGRCSVKDIHHLEIDIQGSGICYHPGDAVGIWYENDSLLVNEFLNLLNFTGKENVCINNSYLPLEDILRQRYEIMQNTVVIVKKYACLSHNLELSSLITDEKNLKNFAYSTPIIEMFRRFSYHISITELLMLLRPLTPRFYSIASSQDEVGEEIHITVSAIRYEVNNHKYTGGASGYLIDRLKENSNLKIFIVSNDNFRLPGDVNIPIIMICSGTGIAPFRAFMQQRSFDNSSGKNWLFFGNPSFINDFLYQLEWQRYVKDGLLNRVHTAWSRDQDKKIYVQDKIRENGSEVWSWITNGAYIYVCGNASNMARDVELALLDVIVKYGHLRLEEAHEFLNKMRTQRRYQRDIY